MVSPKPRCNCRMKESCPHKGDCLQSSVAYACKVTSNDTTEDSPYYIGLTENIFKDNMIYKHKNSFKYETKKNSTELANHVWVKKKDKLETPLQWYMKEQVKAYSSVTKKMHVMKVSYFIF